ncbi:PREDICTED: zinc finger CCCH domain-containing protein 11-like [Fragaria vesca subsp. vesca]
MKALLEEESEKIAIEDEIENQLFIADASLFVDDAEAHEKYHRQEEPEASAEKIEHEAATNASQT